MTARCGSAMIPHPMNNRSHRVQARRGNFVQVHGELPNDFELAKGVATLATVYFCRERQRWGWEDNSSNLDRRGVCPSRTACASHRRRWPPESAGMVEAL
ncbi:hypothetical protein EMEDMD4_1280074 [Sinorhizobium medicae]|uniref:Uncharacterized protein n=1 Tax=Sinorhizobium medicae TaxID=110321 RepID=A0A508WSX0_9HYPH|nr:hypothetical protein EMEDMD4_1280074 [Sinorhizobium medicae]